MRQQTYKILLDHWLIILLLYLKYLSLTIERGWRSETMTAEGLGSTLNSLSIHIQLLFFFSSNNESYFTIFSFEDLVPRNAESDGVA